LRAGERLLPKVRVKSKEERVRKEERRETEEDNRTNMGEIGSYTSRPLISGVLSHLSPSARG
jgi:hypothetical protein